MDKRFGSPSIRQDHRARALVHELELLEQELSISGAILYYDFPLFRDESGTLYRPRVVLLTRTHGVFLFSLSDELEKADSELSQLDSVVFAKLVKSHILRKGKRELHVQITSVIYAEQPRRSDSKVYESTVVTSVSGLRGMLQASQNRTLSEPQWNELISLLEGGKGLLRQRERDISSVSPRSKAAILSKVEEEIRNFDRDQRLAAISLVDGPQRIRGLAGSGKTIVLARKAAHIHLSNPEATILFTFWTKSLYDLVKRLITKAYRQYDDCDPDWDKIDVLHAWGGKQLAGVYYNACIENGHTPIPLNQVPSNEKNPFNYVCTRLVESGPLQQKYDYVLVDEGQDFPSSFYKLCFHLTKGGERDRNVIWAYDELQTILETEVQNVKETFGSDRAGVALMDLARAQKNLSEDLMPHDVILHTCYRNPPEILVAALALGFGIYSTEHVIVQMLENREHWQDLGYVIEQGNCLPGEDTVVLRPTESSPLSVSKYTSRSDIIKSFVAEEFAKEIEWVVTELLALLNEGLRPEDIMVVCLDDRNSRSYFKNIAKLLAAQGISVNNVQQQPYIEPQFYVPDHVTLSTVYSAKGNEAAVVFGIGVDAVFPVRNTRKGRNRLFTTLTRSKAWFRLSGLGASAEVFVTELKLALEQFPRLRFTYPDKKNLELIQRDFSERSSKLMDMQQMLLELGLTDVTEQEIAEVIRNTRGKDL